MDVVFTSGVESVCACVCLGEYIQKRNKLVPVKQQSLKVSSFNSQFDSAAYTIKTTTPMA